MLRNSFLKLFFVFYVLTFLLLLHESDAMFEEIEITPNYSGGFFIGDLSWAQYLVLCLIFLELVVLYAEGLLPVEIHLGNMPGILGAAGVLFGRSLKHQNYAPEAAIQKIDITTFAVVCPLQYLCDLEFWAERPHNSFIENKIASWFRNSTVSLTDPQLAIYAGAGTCQERHPCPFDIQEAVGIRIPGSRNITKIDHDHSDIDLQMSFT